LDRIQTSLLTNISEKKFPIIMPHFSTAWDIVMSIMPPHWKTLANGIGNMKAEKENNNINLPKNNLLKFLFKRGES